MTEQTEQSEQSVLEVARRDFVAVNVNQTVEQALTAVRGRELGEKIVYFYVVDDDDALVGVLPIRRLLMAIPERPVRELMVSRLVTVPARASVATALELFVLHRLLALPVVDEQRRIRGVIDVSQFTDDVLDFAAKERVDTIFESIGIRLTELSDAGPFKAFRRRFPWLLATIAGGTTCALLAGVFQVALETSIVLAFFLTLVLGLGESVAAQSMTFAVQALRNKTPSMAWYLKSLTREGAVGAMLGIASGAIAGLTALIWRGEPMPALVIGISIVGSIIAAASIGLTIPTVLHALKLDPRIAAGPLALALTDLCTILIYLGLATLLLVTLAN